MKPCLKRHDPRPEYAAALVGDVATRAKLSAACGLDDRTLRNYANGSRRMCYGSQWLIESTLGIAAVRRARAKVGAP